MIEVFAKNHVYHAQKAKKPLYGSFYGWSSTASRLWSHFEKTVTFLPLSSQAFLVLLWTTGKDEALSQPWSRPVVLNPELLDWESSILTTSPMLYYYKQTVNF